MKPFFESDAGWYFTCTAKTDSNGGRDLRLSFLSEGLTIELDVRSSKNSQHSPGVLYLQWGEDSHFTDGHRVLMKRATALTGIFLCECGIWVQNWTYNWLETSRDKVLSTLHHQQWTLGSSGHYISAPSDQWSEGVEEKDVLLHSFLHFYGNTVLNKILVI